MESSGELCLPFFPVWPRRNHEIFPKTPGGGIRSRFQQGIPHINAACFLGYDKDEAGHLVINEGQAESGAADFS